MHLFWNMMFAKQWYCKFLPCLWLAAVFKSWDWIFTKGNFCTISCPFFSVSGYSGSGKTFASMLLLRQIFTLNGGLESDTFKQLSAAFTVLRSLGSAQTATNRESSRIGHFIEAQVSNGELYRTKIHCYFLDQVRTNVVVYIMNIWKFKVHHGRDVFWNYITTLVRT